MSVVSAPESCPPTLRLGDIFQSNRILESRWTRLNRLLRITPDAHAKTAQVDVLLAGADFPGPVSTVAIAGNDAFVIGIIDLHGGRSRTRTVDLLLVRQAL